MGKNRISGLMAVILVLVAATVAQAAWRGGMGSGGWGMGSAYQRMYNPQTVETVSGVVESVEKFKPMRGMYSGIHLMVKTEKGVVPVHLGPDWYIDRQDVKFKKGDKVDVTGSKITFDGKPAIIAQQIKKDGGTLVLRNSAGIPEWAGWRRGR
ncbi:MAG: hypothetical protein M0018_10025 [Nitrospiraceae bacterium]|nr:hypothetical protein [Nitrospiraceae bacterium]